MSLEARPVTKGTEMIFSRPEFTGIEFRDQFFSLADQANRITQKEGY